MRALFPQEFIHRVWRRVQLREGIPEFTEDLVRKVLISFKEEMIEDIVRDRKFILRDIGTLRVAHKPSFFKKGHTLHHGGVIRSGTSQLRANFRLSKELIMRIKDTIENQNTEDAGMVKLGVFTGEGEGEDKTVQASTVPTCPLCGSPTQVSGNQRLCPLHGTAPFEK